MIPAPMSPAELFALFAAHPGPEIFGPQSRFPLLVVDLNGADPALGENLRTLPCPVIGIGQGPLATACDVVLPGTEELPTIVAAVDHAPIAAMVLVQHLRASENLESSQALTAESMAYATVQRGPEFQRWKANAASTSPNTETGPPLIMERQGGTLRLILNRPANLNAIDVELRDALCDGFNLAAIDSGIERIELRGAGRCFSIGGDVCEFGLVGDPATAHWIRSIRLPARHVIPVADKLNVRIDGAAIGAGIEIAAFAARIVAAPTAWFQLPELKYGLIPGAGGTVSIPRRIGRQRAAYMMLSMRRIHAALALRWGLIDAIEPASSSLSAPGGRARSAASRIG
jgi:enoyl-CoA hydratase/carnithine racemase